MIKSRRKVSENSVEEQFALFATGGEKAEKRVGAQVTVFLSLILLIMMSLVFTLLESARCEGLRLRVQTAADASIESVFAQYDRYLWDDYGLLFFAGREDNANELKNEAKKYAEKNRGYDWLSFLVSDVTVPKYISATDANGSVFIKETATYMKACGLVDAALELAEKVDDSGASSTLESEDIYDDGEVSFDAVTEKIDNADSEVDNAEAPTDENGEEVETVTDEEAEETYDDLKKQFSNWRKKGFLMLVCDDVDDISEEPFEMDDFPSKLSSSTKSKNKSCISDASATEKILCKEYCMRSFDSYLTKNREGLELEYILCGKDSDLANLTSVVKRLIGIRMALNYASFQRSSGMKAQAAAIASGVAGWTCNPAIVKAVKEVIIVIWSLAESVSDVRGLLDGNKIPLMKKSNEWSLSLSGVASGKEKTGSSKNGLGYEDYLRVLLYLRDCEDISYRAMDVIQMKICKKEPAFLMKNCIYGAKIKLVADAGAMFPYLPGTIDYDISAESAFSYGKTNLS